MEDFIFRDYIRVGISGLTNNMEFEDMFPSNGMILHASPQDFEVDLDSPMSLELGGADIFSHTHTESVSSLLGDDNINSSYPPAISPSLGEDDQSDVSSVRAISPNCASPLTTKADDLLIEKDRSLIAAKFEGKQVLPPNNDWNLGERLDRLLAVSPCRKYTKDFLMRLDEVEDADRKVDILIEFVCHIRQEFPWNHVEPKELFRAYTSVTCCKKEKKKDAEGHVNPKRPMNAFMIWSKQCRSFISQICPQLHNATISKKLGAWWRKFSNEEKEMFEREKVILTKFHAYEFPEYKYRPRKKATKKADEKPESDAKEKPNRKRKSPSTKQNNQSQPQPPQKPLLRGINISEPRANLDPALQRKLQSKMNVKIDPNMRRDVSLSQGNCLTGVNLTDLPHSSSSSLGPVAKRLCLQPIEVQQQTVPPTTIDLADTANSSTVFDTPGNSPLTPVTPVTPNEPVLNVVPTNSQGQRCFDFNVPTTSVPVLVEQLASANNNSIVFASNNGSRFLFPVSVNSLQKASGFQNNIITVGTRNLVSEHEANNNVVINNNNALLYNKNVNNTKKEPFLIQSIVKSEPILLQGNTVNVKHEPLFLQTDNVTLQPDPPLMQANQTVKHEPISPQSWSLSLKSEPDHFCSMVKTEPEVNNELSMPPSAGLDLGSIDDLPILTVETIDDVLSDTSFSNSNDNLSLLTEIMNLPVMRETFLTPSTV